MNKKLFVDDCRSTPDGWDSAKTFLEAKTLLETGEYIELSLDHDLGGDWETGYTLCMWMVENLPPSKWPLIIHVHSSNPAGTLNMLGVLYSYAPTRTVVD